MEDPSTMYLLLIIVIGCIIFLVIYVYHYLFYNSREAKFARWQDERERHSAAVREFTRDMALAHLRNDEFVARELWKQYDDRVNSITPELGSSTSPIREMMDAQEEQRTWFGEEITDEMIEDFKRFMGRTRDYVLDPFFDDGIHNDRSVYNFTREMAIAHANDDEVVARDIWRRNIRMDHGTLHERSLQQVRVAMWSYRTWMGQEITEDLIEEFGRFLGRTRDYILD